MNRTCNVCLGATMLLGCATTNPAGARQEVAGMIDERVGVTDAIAIEQDAEARDELRERVSALASKPLSLDGALELAMLNNPRLAAELEGLGVAQAELVQAGLLANPSVGGDLKISTLGNGLGGGFSVAQSLLSAFLIPAKKKIARANLKAAIVRIGDESLQLAHDVRVAYVDVLAADASLALRREMLQLAETADELAQRQREAGNIPANEREELGVVLDESRLEHGEAALARVETRERMTRLLGLWGAQAGWSLAGALPEPPSELPALDRLESIAIENRLDVSAARFDVESMRAALRLRRAGVIPAIEVGVEGGNEVGDDIGHEWVVGPSLSIELPLFDPGHADFARLRAMLRQSQHQLDAVAVDARSEVRERRAALVFASQRAAYYRETIVPRHDRLAESMLERYNAMLIGGYELIDVRHERLDAALDRVEAVREFWTAQSGLELAIGGRLEAP